MASIYLGGVDLDGQLAGIGSLAKNASGATRTI
jgi:hypothetical protein